MKLVLKALSLAMMICVSISAAPFSASADSVYIRGDADGDGKVTISDVTMVQRLIANSVKDTKGAIKRRANVNGGNLDITDVTAIQRYLAGMENVYIIGASVKYDEYELPFIPI